MSTVRGSEKRRFSVSITGSPATLRDVMVAAFSYGVALETRFQNACELVSCFQAWREEIALRPGNVSEQRLRQAKRFEDAHRWTDRQSRHLLSNPLDQEFELTASDR
jgi:hypothetical protein